MEIIYAGPHRNGRTARETDPAPQAKSPFPQEPTPALQVVELERQENHREGLFASRALAGGNLFID